MATTQGTAIVWSVSTTNMTGFTAAVSARYTFTGGDWANEKDKVEVKDGDVEIKTVYYYNSRKTLGLKCYPSGASASATSIISEKVAVASATDSDINGDWICDSISKARSQDGIVKFDLGLVSCGGITPA